MIILKIWWLHCKMHSKIRHVKIWKKCLKIDETHCHDTYLGTEIILRGYGYTDLNINKGLVMDYL